MLGSYFHMKTQAGWVCPPACPSLPLPAFSLMPGSRELFLTAMYFFFSYSRKIFLCTYGFLLHFHASSCRHLNLGSLVLKCSDETMRRKVKRVSFYGKNLVSSPDLQLLWMLAVNSSQIPRSHFCHLVGNLLPFQTKLPPNTHIPLSPQPMTG